MTQTDSNVTLIIEITLDYLCQITAMTAHI